MGGNAVLQLASGGDRARVVDTSRAVEGGHVTTASLVNTVGESVAVVGTGCTFADHAEDGCRWAWVLHVAVVVTGVVPVVILHQTGVTDAVVGGRSADAAA